MNLANEHQFSVRVYTEETDLTGIVYHANYLSFLERARTEIIRKADLSLTTLAEYDCYFVINDAHIRYLHPARLDDLLTITSRIETRKSCSVVFEQMIHNQENKLLCIGYIKVVCVDKALKPKRLPTELFKE